MKFAFEDLEVWNLSLDFSASIVTLAKELPPEEKFALAAQVRRAAFSISLNIAEGSGRKTKKDFAHFVRISIGSLLEVVAALKIAERLGYIASHQCSELNQQSEKLYFKLVGLEKYLKK